MRILVNTALMGHSEAYPSSIMQDALEYSGGTYPSMNDRDTEQLLERFGDYAIDENGAWRLSDYASRKLNPLVEQLVSATTATQKIMLIDLILNVTHQRSDLASWFVEGGTRTLNVLFEESEGEAPSIPLIAQEKFMNTYLGRTLESLSMLDGEVLHSWGLSLIHI